MDSWSTLFRATCWLVIVLSAACAAAGAGVDDMAFDDLRLQNVAPPKGLTHRPVPPSSTAPTPRQIGLADPSLASTAQKRQQLSYLVQCALPADVELYAQQGSERFTFPGRMGLAPRWLTEAMTPSEERWVSACLLARINCPRRHRPSRSLKGDFLAISSRRSPSPIPVWASAPLHKRWIPFCRIVSVLRSPARQRTARR
jgi:hypothetical protein